MRWFLGPAETTRAAAFGAWFLPGRAPAASRQDVYVLDPEATDLGVKSRGGKTGLEVKALVDPSFCELRPGGRVTQVQLWTKVTSKKLALPDATRTVQKTRRLRKFDTHAAVATEIELGAGASGEDPISGEKPALGCNVEWTALEVGGSAGGWTFALEAFAGDARLDALRHSLEKTIAALAAMPPLDDAWVEQSYPGWLGTFA